MVGLIFIVLFSYVVICVTGTATFLIKPLFFVGLLGRDIFMPEFTRWKPNVISEAELNKCSIDLPTMFISFISMCPFNVSSSREEFILDISSRSIFSVKSSLSFS